MTPIRILTLAVLASTLLGVRAETTNTVAAITQQEVVEAALYGKTDVVEKALKQGYKVNERDPENRTVLMYAAFNGQTDIVKKLIDAGADVNAQDQIGTSPLMFAASAPAGTETVQLLLDSGAKINMVDNNEHFSALMWAAAEGQAENVKLLLKNKANLSLEDIDGDTAETFADKAGHAAVAQILKEAAAKTEAPKKEAAAE
ncbi:hypothetical protein PDESU_06532 [Pontiella desulfatans]|uniref:Uncharacterized protein n=1 Tax=Pontiella desulfatans TaxID=2750659 RepID=A0A6C2UCR7_PONDE|nr:ankyrin repeat domain-containing protein [Pontiella desulfatans]VGO17930.1 hypothetical protein PDESU_06532 [Pontiella desulfatans]